MTSFGTNIIRESGYMPTFKVQGQIYHSIGSIFPNTNESAKFLQVYFLGPEQQINQRQEYFEDLDATVLRQIQDILFHNNRLVTAFKTAIENAPSEDFKVVIRADKTPLGEHPRRYNAPEVPEVAILLVDDQHERRDIVIQSRQDGPLQHICETHRSYDALQYPLLFCHGEDGYHFTIPLVDPVTGNALPGKKTSSMQFYCFRLMVRNDMYNHLFYFRHLFHQFLVDMFAKIDSERLRYIRQNQKKLRATEYIHLRDAVNNDVDARDIGQFVILPSSHTGSPRYMHERTQDAMTYVRKYGRPDLFITFTCNPKWEEIQDQLFQGQLPSHRPDIIARAFRQKLLKLMDLLVKGKCFGDVICRMYTVEWQKRGLPHAHILLWLAEKIRSDQIDSVISAELPDPAEDRQLYDIVTSQMIHGPCGTLNSSSPCIAEG